MSNRSLIGLLIIISTILLSCWDAAAIEPPDIEPNPLEFPDTLVGQTSDPMNLTITNTDTKTNLKVDSIFLGDQTNFQIDSDPCSNKTIQKSSSCDLTLSFTPSEDGHFSTSIAVANDGKNGVDYATITGRGVQPKVTLSRSSIDLGDQPINTTSSEQSVTLVNSGDATLNITEIAASDDFDQTDNCGATLVAQDSCNIDVTFLPTTTGSRSGNVIILDDAEGSPHTVLLSGTGINPGEPGLSLSATSLDFGYVTVSTTSVVQDVTVTSTGTADLIISAVTASGAFDQTNNCIGTFVPGATCTISVTFTPTSEAIFSGTILIDNNTADSPEQISLAGTGTSILPDTPGASLSAIILEFGNQEFQTPSDPKSVTVTNNGTSDLIITTVTLGGEGGTSFSKNDDCHGKTIASGGSCIIEVTFIPGEHGEITGLLSIADNVTGSPQSVTLDGFGVFGAGTGCSLIH